MAFNILPGLGPEHFEDRINQRRGLSALRIPGYFGRFLNSILQLGLILYGAAALCMRLFFRQKNGHKTIKLWSFLFCVFCLRAFFGDVEFDPPSFPGLVVFTNMETLKDWNNLIFVSGDLVRIAWYLFLMIVSLAEYAHKLIVNFDLGFADIFTNGFPEDFTYSQIFFFLFFFVVLISGLGLFARKFANRRNPLRFSFKRHQSSRGESVFFNWAGEKTGHNLDILLIALIAWRFFEVGHPYFGWFFLVGAASLFWEDKMYGDYMHRINGSAQNFMSSKKNRQKFGDVVTL